MGVINLPDGSYQPICDECGIARCWDLSEFEYNERKEYWDRWTCEFCDPEYFKKWAEQHRAEHFSKPSELPEVVAEFTALLMMAKGGRK